jgi:hypothetical protein
MDVFCQRANCKKIKTRLSVLLTTYLTLNPNLFKLL